MKIIRAQHLGMCFGVRDAIALAYAQSEKEPVTVFGELVHNQNVLADLHRRGIRVETNDSRLQTNTVLITAHGASDTSMARLRGRGLNVIEATCPLVHVAHSAVRKLVEEGFHPVIVGKRDHVEVRGLTEDLSEYDVVLSEDDVANLAERPRYGVVAQTTQPVERVQRLIQLLRDRFPKSIVRYADTVCQPTKLRQASAVALARQCDVVIVIGGSNSNNTRELAETCQRHCERVFHVQTAADVRAEWIEEATTVGITAGTSTPDAIIDAVEAQLWSLATKVRTQSFELQPT